ncbi:putative LPS assembly protein LptD [Bacteroides gallinaceum]|uniref:LPS assembly protein LptD n=2 Tax=Bacteroidaceae TaxID=815 RepID=A0ABT7VEA7_9BACE|nr:putative LPS assembly protein LptD [Bacteroides gallinaceum]MBU3856031.1 LPS-assembly protein LptD [Candidatus Phocaeicola excrementipullorum]MBW9198853.1 LPS-assembly protein LptD [Bacteroidales bacterium SW299]MDM8324602.1 putative LPS assembly protein LptD [Bacteroides gallinaceum]
MTSLKKTTYLLIALFLLGFFCSFYAEAQRVKNRRLRRSAGKEVRADSVRTDSLLLDSLALDSLAADSLAEDTAKKKEPLDAPVIYEASDSIVFTKEGYAHLYGEGKVNYQNIELTSAVISMNMDSSTVYAHGVEDTAGVATGLPVFKDGETPYESKTMRYNFKTKKGFINNIVTQQGEGYVTSEEGKKGADDEIYMRHGKYTTCDNHDHPHFYMKLSMAKVRPKKNVVFGPAQLVVEDVPLPIAVPFGFFPFNSSYSSGFIMPTYGDEMNRGFYLRDGGYYFAISDKMDLKVLGEIFTKGSWGLSVASNYNKRYKYSGSFNASYLVTKTGEKNMPDYAVSKDFRLQWSHRQDAKANPNSSFSASVNFSTSSYDRSSLSSLYNPQVYAQNTKASSVSYSRTFSEIGLSISGTFNITQNTRDSSINMTLPDVNISLNRIYPFKRKKSVGDEKWYEKISLQYTGSMTNSISTKDNLLFKTPLTQWDNGMQHRIPISATFNLFKYINIVPSFNYTERWYLRKVKQSYDPNPNSRDHVRRDTINGFNRVWDYNLSLQMNTKLYGMYKPLFMKSKEIQIRHVFTPTVSYTYTPDFGKKKYGYYDTYTYTDENGEVQTVEYSPYEGAVYSYPGKGMSQNISFSVDNNIEMKFRSDKDSTGYKKVSLIDQLGASLSYDVANKRWSDLSMNLRLKLTKSYTFNMNASFATYAYEFDENGNVVVGDRTEWSYGRFGRFQGYSGSFSYTLNNDTFKKLFGKKEDKEKEGKEEDNADEESDEEATEETDNKSNMRKTEAATIDSDGYLAFKFPWSISLSYSYSIREDRTKKINIKKMRYPYSLTHSLNVSGNFKIGSRWNMTYSTGYDFTSKEMSMTTLNITRDLHCFNMSCGLVFGPFTSYNFSIRANSSMLTDALKWDQRSNTGSAVTWY